MNLPREERFKTENLILVGLIPAMTHEPVHLNFFLQPLVDELKKLYNGVRMYTYESPMYAVLLRAMLLCVACDIPAARKVCGFKSHAAIAGCSRCLKKFHNRNYSGFVRSSWPKRDLSTHRDIANQIRQCYTQNERDKLEKEYGIKDCVLLQLEYFDPIRYCIIDPMHNLFLGTAKHILKNIWLDESSKV